MLGQGGVAVVRHSKADGSIRLAGKGRSGSEALSAVKWKRSRHSTGPSAHGSLAPCVSSGTVLGFCLQLIGPVAHQQTFHLISRLAISTHCIRREGNYGEGHTQVAKPTVYMYVRQCLRKSAIFK